MAMHTELCTECMQVKPTGLSMTLYAKWKKNIGQRSAIERSTRTLTGDLDLGLLHDQICFACGGGDYSNCEGIETKESIEQCNTKRSE